MADVLAPGLATVTLCGACDQTGRVGKDGRYPCGDCQGLGLVVWKACPSCGSGEWVYRNGRTDQDGMACRSCGASWTKDLPAWTAQHVPDSMILAKAG